MTNSMSYNKHCVFRLTTISLLNVQQNQVNIWNVNIILVLINKVGDKFKIHKNRKSASGFIYIVIYMMHTLL